MSDHDIENIQMAFQDLRSGKPTVLRGKQLDSAAVAQIIASLEPLRNAVNSLNVQDRWPCQPPVGSVLRFERRFSSRTDAQPYTYVAVRIDTTDGTKWYVTGRRQLILAWEDMKNLIGDSPCWLVTSYKEIPRPVADPLENIDNPADWFTAVFGGGVEHDPETDGKDTGKKNKS